MLAVAAVVKVELSRKKLAANHAVRACMTGPPVALLIEEAGTRQG
jgi:hypothetical protein